MAGFGDMGAPAMRDDGSPRVRPWVLQAETLAKGLASSGRWYCVVVS
jgi:hypothetical protein